MVHNKRQHMHIFTYSPNCHQQFSTSIWFIDHKYLPSTQQHHTRNSHQIHTKYFKHLWLISTSMQGS